MASISKLACLCFPGFLLMETVFQRGLFSGGVDTVYQFVLFVFWSVALSIPFVFVPLIVFLVRFAPHWAIDGNQEKQKNMFYMMGHPYVFISSFICYLLVKLGALLAPPTWNNILGVPILHSIFLASTLIVVLLQALITPAYFRAFHSFVMKHAMAEQRPERDK